MTPTSPVHRTSSGEKVVRSASYSKNEMLLTYLGYVISIAPRNHYDTNYGATRWPVVGLGVPPKRCLRNVPPRQEECPLNVETRRCPMSEMRKQRPLADG